MKNTVRELREAMSLTAEELGDQVGASRQTISAIENGKYSPRLGLAFRIAKVFGKPIEEVFEDDGDSDDE